MSATQGLAKDVAQYYAPPPEKTVTEWAEENRILSRENCALPGPYRVSVTPYLKEILDCITDRYVERIVCQKSAQVAWTDGVINNAVGYYIDQDPAPMLILFPTDGMAKRYSKEKLAPMIRDTEPLKEKVAEAKSRDSGNTLESKNFQGGHLELVGSNAPSKLASSPIRIILVEEPDRCSRNAGGEGNSLKLVYERGKTFHNRKIILGGSPTIKTVSEIEREMELSDQRHFYIPCPHCGESQKLEWTMVVWDQDETQDHLVYGKHDPETARFKCRHCEEAFTNAQKNKALQQGKWKADKPFNGIAGFYLNELYSPFPKARVQDVVAKFLEAKKYLEQGDPTLMITWTNTSLGETWEETGETVEHHFLYQRREHYNAPVPAGSLILTAGVDCQDDRLECEIVAWGLGEESFSVDYIRLYNDLTKPQVWNILAEMLRKTYMREDGILMDIKAVCIDSGGHFTDEVYQFSKKHGVRWMIPIKGASTPGRPVADFPRTKNKKGVYLTFVGTDTAKETIYQRYNLLEPGPGYCHWPISDTYDEEYFKQATAETKIKKYRRGMEYFEWTKGAGQRNEALDCRVYAFAAIRILQQHRRVNLEQLHHLYLMQKNEPKTQSKTRRRPKVVKSHLLH